MGMLLKEDDLEDNPIAEQATTSFQKHTVLPHRAQEDFKKSLFKIRK